MLKTTTSCLATLCLLLVQPCRTAAQNWFGTGQDADLMISGVDFNQSGGPLRFNHPNGLASDGNRLLVCDRFNNRVLVWNQAPDTWNALPDLVLGQQHFNSNDPGTGKNRLNWPGNAALAANGTLAIADTDNDRILIWNSFPTVNGQAADRSIHLPTLSPQGSPVRWGWPWGVWTDGKRLAAVATSGAAILFWNTLPTADNQPPDYTISLPQFGTPRNISTDGSTYFFVGDHNAKVTGNPGTFFWNTYPAAANTPFDFYRDEWIKGCTTPTGQLVAGGLMNLYVWNTLPRNAAASPDVSLNTGYYQNGDGPDVVFARNRLYVNNYNGNNILVYPATPSPANPDPAFAVGVQNFRVNSLDSIAYIQNGVLATDGKRLLVTSDFDRVLKIYNKLPDRSGAFPDTTISLLPLGFAPWDNALQNNTFVMAGRNGVAVWNDVGKLQQAPSLIFRNKIGNIALSDLKGVALDDQFLYLAERTGKIHIWKGVPNNQNTDPAYTISLDGAELNRISSDGKYLCVAKISPPSGVYLFRVSDIALGNLSPWKIISSQPGMNYFNLASDALAFDGSLAVANQGNNNVLLWKDINDAGDYGKVVVLGQPGLASIAPAIGRNRLFMPGALMAYRNQLWVGEFKFSSRILRFSYPTATATAAPDGGSDNLNVYPNPATSDIFVEGKVLQDRHVLQLFDLSGHLWWESTADGIADRHTMDGSNLPAGFYLLVARNMKTGQCFQSKVVVQH